MDHKENQSTNEGVHSLNGVAKQQIQFYLRLWNGKGLKLTKPVSWNIGQIKEIVGSHFQIPENEIKVIFRGRELENQVTLEDVKVSQNSILHIMRIQNQEIIMVELLFAQQKLRRKIFIKANESILSLKQNIYEFTQLPIEHQILVYCGGQLRNDRFVSDYLFNTGSIIPLIDKRIKGQPSEDCKAWFKSQNFSDGCKMAVSVQHPVYTQRQGKSENKLVLKTAISSVSQEHKQQQSSSPITNFQQKHQQEQHDNNQKEQSLEKQITENQQINNNNQVSEKQQQHISTSDIASKIQAVWPDDSTFKSQILVSMVNHDEQQVENMREELIKQQEKILEPPLEEIKEDVNEGAKQNSPLLSNKVENQLLPQPTPLSLVVQTPVLPNQSETVQKPHISNNQQQSAQRISSTQQPLVINEQQLKNQTENDQILKILLSRDNGISLIEEIPRSAIISTLINQIRENPNLTQNISHSITLKHNGVQLQPQQRIEELNWKPYEVVELFIEQSI